MKIALALVGLYLLTAFLVTVVQSRMPRTSGDAAARFSGMILPWLPVLFLVVFFGSLVDRFRRCAGETVRQK